MQRISTDQVFDMVCCVYALRHKVKKLAQFTDQPAIEVAGTIG
jgi:hypothetical protein